MKFKVTNHSARAKALLGAKRGTRVIVPARTEGVYDLAYTEAPSLAELTFDPVADETPEGPATPPEKAPTKAPAPAPKPSPAKPAEPATDAGPAPWQKGLEPQ